MIATQITIDDLALVADILDEVSSLIDHNGIGQIADLIRDGEYDGHECVQIAARHRLNYVQQNETPVADVTALVDAVKELADILQYECDVPPCVGSMAPAEHALGKARLVLAPFAGGI